MGCGVLPHGPVATPFLVCLQVPHSRRRPDLRICTLPSPKDPMDQTTTVNLCRARALGCRYGHTVGDLVLGGVQYLSALYQRRRVNKKAAS